MVYKNYKRKEFIPTVKFTYLTIGMLSFKKITSAFWVNEKIFPLKKMCTI